MTEKYGFCVECGREIQEGMKFCPECGADIPGSEAEMRPVEVSMSQSESDSRFRIILLALAIYCIPVIILAA